MAGFFENLTNKTKAWGLNTAFESVASYNYSTLDSTLYNIGDSVGSWIGVGPVASNIGNSTTAMALVKITGSVTSIQDSLK